MGTQFTTSLEDNCSTMKVLIITGFCLSSILSPVFGGSGSGSGVGYPYVAGSGMGSGMPGECCPLKAIMGNPDPSLNGLYMLAGYADMVLPLECRGGDCIYTKDGYGGQKYCMAPSDDSEVMCLWEGMGMSGYGSMMSGYGSMMSGYGSMMSGSGSMMSGYGSGSGSGA